jgi:hypothetical protein
VYVPAQERARADKVEGRASQVPNSVATAYQWPEFEHWRVAVPFVR